MTFNMGDPDILKHLIPTKENEFRPLFVFDKSIMEMLSGFAHCDSKKLRNELLNFICYNLEFVLGCIGPQDSVSSEALGFEK